MAIQTQRPDPDSRRTYSRLIGALFLLGFVAYGVGFGLVTSVVGAPEVLSKLPARQSTLAFGAFLMLLNTVTDLGKGALFFPILESHGRRTALTYLAAMIVEVVMMAVGILCLLMLVPLGRYGADGGAPSAPLVKVLASLLTESNTMAYQIAMMSLAVGSFFVWVLAFRTRLFPRWLSIWGAVGYVIFLAGAVAELFGVHIGLALSAPGGLFEVALGLWLLIKGLQPEPYGPAIAVA